MSADDDILAALAAQLGEDPRPELVEFFGDELVDAGIEMLSEMVRNRWAEPGAEVAPGAVAAMWSLLVDSDRCVVRGRAHAERRVGSQAWPHLVGAWLGRVCAENGRDLSGLTEDQLTIAACGLWDDTEPSVRELLVERWHAAGERAQQNRQDREQ